MIRSILISLFNIIVSGSRDIYIASYIFQMEKSCHAIFSFSLRTRLSFHRTTALQILSMYTGNQQNDISRGLHLQSMEKQWAIAFLFDVY